MMFSFTRTTPKQSVEAVVGAELCAESRESDGKILAALEAIGNGEFDTGRTINGPIGDTLHTLADKLEGKSRTFLAQTVDFSMQASEAMASVSQLTGDIRAIDENTGTMAAAIEEMAASTNHVAASSNEAAQEAQQVETVAGEAITEIDQAVQAMKDITSQVENMARRLTVLEQAAQHIGGMAQSIEEISDQTKLLALNATIEAARAGDAGKGFSVVASEVKALSSQTSTATDQIRERIKTLNEEMAEMSSAMEASALLVHDGEGVVSTVGGKIHQMNNQVSSVTSRMNEIASVLDQQRDATSEIAENVSQISTVADRVSHRADTVIKSVGKSEQLVENQFAQLESDQIPNYVLYRAKSDHLLWKKRLAEMLVGLTTLKAEELADHHSCRLGKWYDAVTDVALINRPAFKALMKPHDDVHTYGRAAAVAYAAGDRDRAIAEYTRMEEASQEVVKLLTELIG